MLFEQENYYKYIQTLEKIKTAYYVIFILIGILIGATTTNGLAIITGGLIGFFAAAMSTLAIKIKIQKMKWEMDIYNKINEKNSIKSNI